MLPKSGRCTTPPPMPIPLLVLFTKTDQQAAQGINLLYFIPTAIAALFIHIKNKKIEFKHATKLILFSLPWAIISSIVAVNMKSEILQKMFAVMLLVTGLYQLFTKEESDEK
jgi:uncharacterized membrane protein YfcA